MLRRVPPPRGLGRGRTTRRPSARSWRSGLTPGGVGIIEPRRGGDMVVTRRIDDPGAAERAAAGDPVYRDAVAALEPLVPASPTGRWCVLRERTDWLPDDPARFSVYGPYGSG